MLINPINNINSNKTTYKAIIKPTSSLKQGFDMLEKYSDSCTTKDMNSVKDFLDSLAKINATEKVPEFKIDIDKRREGYTYTKINGKRLRGGHNSSLPMVQDSYLTVEGVKRYAEKLEDIGPSPLDILKAQIDEAEQKLDELKERYSNRLKAEFAQAKKMIFDDVK